MPRSAISISTAQYIPVRPQIDTWTACYWAVPPIGAKKREKKRENLEIRRCSLDHDPHSRASRRFAGRIFGDRGEKKTTFLLPTRAFLPRLCGEISSPCVGFSGRRRTGRRNVSPRGEKERDDKNVDSFISSSMTFDKDVEGRKHLQPSAKNEAKKPQNRSRGNEEDRLFRCSSYRLAITSWIEIVEGGRAVSDRDALRFS
ncbi:hypothetical protein BHM03_00026044 [Ensete ventricosum]|nr:hypothetical protein BHM03_00026044 [Ensete ventricosum]